MIGLLRSMYSGQRRITNEFEIYSKYKTRICSVPPQLCSKRRENQSAAQLTGHCKTGGIRSLAANRCAGEIVVVSKRGERQQSESGFEYTPNAVEGRRKGAPPKPAGASRSAPA